MATLTGGTNANNSLPTGIQFGAIGSAVSYADWSAISNAIINRVNVAAPLVNNTDVGGLDESGRLWIPNRSLYGPVQILPGDYVFVTSRGYPLIIPSDEFVNGLFHHS